jgi:hypothetical protein
MSNIFTRRDLPLTLGLPLMLQMIQQLKADEPALDADHMKSLAIKWPKDLEFPEATAGRGNQQLVVFGNPAEDGGIYGVKQRWNPHSNSRPHRHKHDRYIWVLKGIWWVGAGANYSMDTTVPVPAGSFVTHKAMELHYDGAKDEPCELFIVGLGPAANINPEGAAPGGRGKADE